MPRVQVPVAWRETADSSAVEMLAGIEYMMDHVDKARFGGNAAPPS